MEHIIVGILVLVIGTSWALFVAWATQWGDRVAAPDAPGTSGAATALRPVGRAA